MKLWLDIKKAFLESVKAYLFGFIFGVFVCQFYSYNTIIKDCSVIGAFRIGDIAFSCYLHTK
jgi:hypothetical protein